MATERVQEVPEWAREAWDHKVRELEAVGLVPLPPALRQVTVLYIEGGKQVMTPTAFEDVDRQMTARPDSHPVFVEVASLDYVGEVMKIRRSEIVGWLAAVRDDEIPERKPVAAQAMEMPPGFPPIGRG